ncbi:MAG: C10 family peptidase [Chitinispirillales bacterium]|jgi:hypothetical protein|nr:C10 family peptidase [Chitinispirillales bacterium]
MDKRVFYIVLLCFGFTVGEPVSFETAQKVANNYLQQSGKNRVQLASVKRKRDVAPFFIFNKGDGNGFIIVSANDVATPVLGETDSGNFDENNLPPPFQWFLSCYEAQINEAIENKQQDAETELLWEKYLNGSPQIRGEVRAKEFLVKSEWDQWEPFNLLTPKRKTDGMGQSCPNGVLIRAFAGCIAVSMGQVMRYWKHPAQITKDIPGYTSGAAKIQMSAVTVSQAGTYDYNNMLDKYPYDGKITVSGGCNDAYPNNSGTVQQNAMAKLLFHAAVSVKMDWFCGSVGSGAYDSDILPALRDYFDYDGSSMKFIIKNAQYTDEQWLDIIVNEINNNRPIIAEGGGHSYLVDGYDPSDKQIHVNWGYGSLGGSSAGGWFQVKAAKNPVNSSINPVTKMVYGIKPNGKSLGNYELATVNLRSNKTKAVHGEEITVYFDTLKSVGGDAFPGGEFNVALVDNVGNIVERIGYKWTSGGVVYNTFGIGKLGASLSDITVSCKLSNTVQEGAYRLMVVSKPTDSNVWRISNNGKPASVNFQVGNTLVTNAETPTISTHPASVTVNQNATHSLSASASVGDGGNLTYQWYSNTFSDNNGGTKITGATASTYSCPTATIGTYYYYVEVTNTNSSASGVQTATRKSNAAIVTVKDPSQTVTLSIDTQPADTTTVTVGKITQSLLIEASVTGGASITYKWHLHNEKENKWEVINGATSKSYALPSSLAVGEHYYYCNVSAGSVQINVGTFTVEVIEAQGQTVFVNNGSGGGTYFAEDIVMITANPASDGDVFDRWETYDNITLANIYGESTTFTMPDFSVTVAAVYKGENVAVKSAKDTDERLGIKLLPGNIVSQTVQICAVLPDNAKVKQLKVVIFDNVGNVVFEETVHNKASVVWNLSNASGRAVANGMYLAIVECKGADKNTYRYYTKFGVRK